MFDLDPKPVFVTDVFITQPGSEPPRLLKLHFKHQTSSQVREFMSGKLPDSEIRERMLDHVDESAKVAGQSDSNFLDVLFEKFPTAQADIVRTYLRELTESRVKNS